MNKSDFNYYLPQELIAQTPIAKRDSSRLMVLNKNDETIKNKYFYDIIDYLNEGDLLVMNDSRVIPARIYGKKLETGGKIEFLLLKQHSNLEWEVLTKPGKKAKIGAKFIFGDDILEAEIIEIIDDGNRIVRFKCKNNENIYSVLDKIGQMPLPHYITEHLEDNERYQTVYSKENGSAAAPTAGLHFTKELLNKIENKGIKTAFVTLHVGLGTFRPVKENNILDHKMHSEHYSLSEETANLINQTKLNGKRVIAVGTTSTRTLETIARDNDGKFVKSEGDTDIFIYPGYKFKAIDALITNFHLPESTLIMLVSAFSNREFILNAYKKAVEEKYRFFSFGDAMLIGDWNETEKKDKN